MVKNKFINREKGSIAIYAIATVLSFIFILGGIFFTSAVIRKNQLRTMIKIKEIYAQDIGRADEIAEELKKKGEEINIEPSEFQYTGEVQEWTVPATGKYKLEVWGAQGGGNISYPGGKGGYSKGVISLSKGDILYVYVGQQGTKGSTARKRTFGNGGYGYASSGIRGDGGGASDIRLNNEASSLYSRVIVAGGGGGNLDSSGYGAGNGGRK